MMEAVFWGISIISFILGTTAWAYNLKLRRDLMKTKAEWSLHALKNRENTISPEQLFGGGRAGGKSQGFGGSIGRLRQMAVDDEIVNRQAEAQFATMMAKQGMFFNDKSGQWEKTAP